MKVLHISSAITWRGGEQQIAWLYQQLAHLGVDQWICCVTDSRLAQWCSEQAVPHVTYAKGASISPFPGRVIARFCREQKIDLLHIHDSHAHTFALSAAVLWACRVPMVLSRRVDFPISPHFFSRWKYNHPAIRRIICVSEFIRQILSPQIVEKEKLVVVADGVDLHRFSHRKDGKLHRELHFSPDLWLVANVAAIAPHKDYFTFVDTVALLHRDQFPAQYLIIGGDGGEEAAIRAYIEQKGLAKQIHLLGFRDDVAAILPEIDVLLFTSKTEGLGSSLLDAFACGVPVVATRAGGVPEIVQDGTTGLLAEVGQSEALAAQVWQLYKDAPLRKALVAQAAQMVKQYSVAAMAKQTLAVYQDILSKNLESL